MNPDILQARLSQAPVEQVDRNLLVAGRAYLELGQANKAAQVLSEFELAHFKFSHNREKFTLINTFGELCLHQGKLHLAAATYQPLLDLVAEHPLDPILFEFHYGLCRLYYEWNYLEKAKQYLLWCLEKIHHSRLAQTLLLVGYRSLTWVLWAEGQDQAADEAMQQAITIAQLMDDPGLIKQAKAHQARLWLRRGKLDAAAYWAEEYKLSGVDPIKYKYQFEYLTLVRVFINQRQSDKAIPLLNQLLQAATITERGSDIVEILALKALAYQALDNLEQALTELAQALCRVEREGYIRTFLDEGAPMADLLQHVTTWGVTLAYVKELLNAFAHSTSHGTVAPPGVASTYNHINPLVEPLTRREIEVLRLVTAGNSNEDVAHFLSIAPTTVKKHLGNILGKLGAKNRTQAVAKAQALDLI